jgi:hypothetical protein
MTFCEHDRNDWTETDDNCSFCEQCGVAVCYECGAHFEPVNDELNAPPCDCSEYPNYPEPDHDDEVLCCPDCERPNQFGERCTACERERDLSEVA